MTEATTYIPEPSHANRSFTSLYCEDIREENNGKLLYLGVFQQRAIFPQLPTIIPSLRVLLQLNCPKSLPFVSAKIQIFMGEKKLIEQNIETPASAWEHIQDDMVGLPIAMICRLDGLAVDMPAKIQPRIIIDDGEVLAAPSLEVVTSDKQHPRF